jgi:creatinine amidohydrolase
MEADKSNYLWLDQLSTVEAAEAAKKGTVIIFPVGSVEEHGVHLPLSTDSLQPEYVAVEVAKKTGCLIAPTMRYGICNAGRNFPGTITINFNTLHALTLDVLSELVRNGFRRIIIMSGHSGSSHMAALRLAAQEIVRRNAENSTAAKVRVMVFSDFDFAEDLKEELAFPMDDGHAGAMETSRVMDIAPHSVKAKGEFGARLLSSRFEVVADPERFFPTGVNGDPTKASAEKGRTLNEYIIAETVNLVDEIKKN